MLLELGKVGLHQPEKPLPAVPFFRADIGQEEIDAVVRVLRSGWLTSGSETQAFEEEFAEFIGGQVEAVAVNSCTAGLHLVLEALSIGPGDQVLVPDITFTATAEVVRNVGAEVVLVDIDPSSLNIDLDSASNAITSRTKAVMPVHMAGHPVDLNELHALASCHKLKIIEDAAHALPTTFEGKLIGGHRTSDAVVFSFYANKTITSGEGGMIVSRHKDLLERCRKMRMHGIDRDVHDRFTSQSVKWQYDVVAPGFKYNITDIASAIGRVQLRKCHRLQKSRSLMVEIYDQRLADLPLILPPRRPGSDLHAWHLYIVQLNEDSPISRSQLTAILDDASIGYSVHYTPLHRLKYWRERYGLCDDDFPNATRYSDRCLTLPLYPFMGESAYQRTIDTLSMALNR